MFVILNKQKIKHTSLSIQILVILCTFFTPINGQNNPLDSLAQLIQTNIPDSTKTDILYQLSMRHDDLDKNIDFTEQLITHCQKTDNQLYIGVGYNLLGSYYSDKDYGLDTVLNAFKQGMIKAEVVKNTRLKAVLSNSMAMAYDKFGQRDKALELYQQAYTILKESGDTYSAIRCLGNIALIFRNDNDLETAKKYYLQAITMANEIDEEVLASQLGNNLAGVYFDQNKSDSAQILYERSIEINRAAGDQYFTSLSLSNLGHVYNKKKQYEIAYTYLSEGYEIASSINDTYCMGTALTYLCENYFQQKQYTQTITAANEALRTLGENGDMTTRSKFYSHLSNSYEALGNYQLAFQNQKIYHSFSDSLFNTNKSEQINKLKIKYEVNQKETENQLLRSEQEVASRTIRNRGFIGIGLIIALILAIGWGTAFYRSNQMKKKHNSELTTIVKQRTQDLKTANEDLENMNRELEQANYELRTFNYIASHDIKEPIRNIGNYTSLIFRKLPDDLKKDFADYFNTVKQSTSQLYTLIEDFAKYTTLSKDETIDKQTISLNSLIDGIENSMQANLSERNAKIINYGLPNLNSSSSLLYTTFKNLIENGIKFNQSSAPTVEIRYQKNDTNHEIAFKDNGIGIEPEFHEKIFEMFKRLHNRGEHEGSGIGLSIAKLSIEKLGGSIDVQSEKDQGSTFIIRLPIS